MTLQEFQKLLDDHDWFYEMSDDHRVFSAGHREEREILKAAMRLGPVAAQMYKDHVEKINATIRRD